jgi:hypothetical protein
MITSTEESHRRKAIGMLLQDFVRDEILRLNPELQKADVISTPPCINGEDIQLSDSGNRIVGDFLFECKSSKRGLVLVYDAIAQSKAHTKGRFNKYSIAVVSNPAEKTPLVVMELSPFLILLRDIFLEEGNKLQ